MCAKYQDIKAITVRSRNKEVSVKRKASLGLSSLAALMTIWCEVPLGQKGTICSVIEMGGRGYM